MHLQMPRAQQGLVKHVLYTYIYAYIQNICMYICTYIRNCPGTLRRALACQCNN